MTKNMGAADRVIRILIALAIGALILTGRLGGVLAVVLGIVAVAFFVTGLVARCPGYVPFGLSTCRKPAGPSSAA